MWATSVEGRDVITASIAECLRPSFFVSYSRKQKREAEDLKSILASYGRSVWFDLDNISIGDLWRNEIKTGIFRSDELVLLLSDDSLKSTVVAEEVAIGLEYEKLIRPVFVARLTIPVPERLRPFHYVDLTDKSSQERRAILQRFFGEVKVVRSINSVDIKLAACRGVWPPFDEKDIESSGSHRAGEIAASLNRFLTRYPPESCLWLNAGLQSCIAGQWDLGLKALREHAMAANTLPGWYFLALHLSRARLILRMAPRDVEEALDAVNRALEIGRNPLVLLLASVLETGGRNFGPANLERRMREFSEALRTVRESESEFIRAYWCLRPSIRVLSPHEEPIKSLIRKMRH
jgi:hypothetical protein